MRKSSAKVDHLERLLEMPRTKRMPTEVERLRARVDKLVAQLGDEFPKQKLARALVAKACDISLADSGFGALATASMTRHATNLLAGHWSAESIETFIES